jgi:DNA-binding CsgD family transcriptional regulator
LRALAATGNASAEVAGAVDLEEILLDTDIDGFRYLLVRMPRPDHSRAILSPREQEIARMVAAGYASKTIASVLNISAWTVATHLRRMFAKLGVNTRAAMVSRLHEMGIVAHTRATAGDVEHPLQARAGSGPRGRDRAAAGLDHALMFRR